MAGGRVRGMRDLEKQVRIKMQENKSRIFLSYVTRLNLFDPVSRSFRNDNFQEANRDMALALD